MSNKKCICFVYTETTGLHKDSANREDVSKKKLFLYARLVVLNYEIGYIENGEYVQEKQVRSIVKPRSMVITEDSVQFHGITNDHALKEGIEIEEVLNQFIKDMSIVDIIVSHNVDFHLRTLMAEYVKFNIQFDFQRFIIIDTISFYHDYGYIKLKDLASKLKVNINDENNTEIIKLVFFKLYKKFKKSVIEESK